jgi:glutamate dehydrogenase/leucine dehydrogenase
MSSRAGRPIFDDSKLDHEEVVVRTGRRSELPVVVAVHSTGLGPAIGGCRLWHYPDVRDALGDAMRLSEAMTYTCAVAGLAHGGGQIVVALPAGITLHPGDRRVLMSDVGDIVESLGGRFAMGPDAGTGPADMAAAGERTAHVFCRPPELGGSGDSSPATATGVLAALGVTFDRLFGSPHFEGRRVAVVGLGQVGSNLARRLAVAGARLIVSDIDPNKQALASELGATWVTPERGLTAGVDVLVPAALGGVITGDLVPRLRCAAIVGPAHNQLADDASADQLREKGILWAPDYVVSGGGIIFAISVEQHGETPEKALDRVSGIGATLAAVLETAEHKALTPAQAALELALQRLHTAGDGGPQPAAHSGESR